MKSWLPLFSSWLMPQQTAVQLPRRPAAAWRRRTVTWVSWRNATIVTIVSSWAVSGCSTSQSNTALTPGYCYGPGCGTNDAGYSIKDAASTVVGTSEPDAGSTWSELCAQESTGCVIASDAGSCDDSMAPSVPNDAGSGNYGAADSGDVSADTVSLTCRVRSVADTIERACEPAGSGGAEAPCRKPTDCGKGLTCIAEGSASLCRPYCCADPESCPSNTYCSTRSTVVARSADSWSLGPNVPVCTPAENCPLTEQYPCPLGKKCTCSSGKACMVVRRRGLTACITPGDGRQGDGCPCFAGYVCSNTTSTCMKLCQPSTNSQVPATGAQCDAGTNCQANNDVPPDWGVCNGLPMLVN